MGGPDQIAWAADLAHVVLVTQQGVAVLADVKTAHGDVVSTKAVVGVAFCPAGDELAIGQQFQGAGYYPQGTTLIVDSASLASQETSSSIGSPAWSGAHAACDALSVLSPQAEPP